MRFVIQRVKSALVKADGEPCGQIGRGLLVFVGIGKADTTAQADRLVKKLCGLRIFEDEQGKTNLSLRDVGGSLLITSQFTLYADCRKGNRPSFTDAAVPDTAIPLYAYVTDQCRAQGFPVETGVFGADMEVSLVNDGPFTLVLTSGDDEETAGTLRL